MVKNILESKQARTIYSVQGLRAIAFLGIFLSHIGITQFSPLGPWGVSIFFILSGFLMIWSYYGRQRISDYSVKENIIFAIRKVERLYPLHIVMMIIMLAFNIRNIDGIKKIIKLLIKLLSNITLMQAFFPNSSIYYSLNSVAWYLSVCFTLYFVFPWILQIYEKYIDEKRALLIIFFTLTSQIIFGYISSVLPSPRWSDDFTKWFVYIFPLSRAEEFILGCSIGIIYIKEHNRLLMNDKYKKIGDILSTILICIFIIMLIMYIYTNSLDSVLSYPQFWWQYTCIFTLPNCFFIFLIACELTWIKRILSLGLLVFIGDISAYAFLVHQIVIRCVRTIVGFIDLPGKVTYIVEILVSLMITIILSYVWIILTTKSKKLKEKNNG